MEHPTRSLAHAPQPAQTAPATPVTKPPVESIGPYKLVELLGEGGFGMVWLAERREPMVQHAAIKLLKPGMDSRAVITRFEHERQALAMMDHPNVARVFDAGTLENGRPYFIMEFDRGLSITEYCDKHRMSIPERLQLFTSVCDAIEHAHMKGIIHRDLKPSNILVSGDHANPVVKVIDFGIAKAVGASLAQQTMLTERGQIVGTIEYMSPEQADLRGQDVDTRSDVYSLGVVLYELITGVLPFESSALRSAGLEELQRIVRHVDPPRPATRISALGPSADTLAQRRHTSADGLRRVLARELEWIPLRAMRKEPGERYRSAADLRDDINNYLRGLPLAAGPESAAYRFRKFVRRRRTFVIAAALVILAVVVGSVGLVVGLVRAREAVAAETFERKRAESTIAFLQGMLESVDPQKAQGRDITVRDILDDAASKVGTRFSNDPVLEASMREVIGETYYKLSRYEEASVHLARAAELRAA
ncbi:MAG: serine/threonine-protein kinase, partial [Phycisphaerales bacterium]